VAILLQAKKRKKEVAGKRIAFSFTPAGEEREKEEACPFSNI